jgi:hypothetical protein
MFDGITFGRIYAQNSLKTETSYLYSQIRSVNDATWRPSKRRITWVGGHHDHRQNSKIEPSDVPYLTKGITACPSQAKKNR